MDTGEKLFHTKAHTSHKQSAYTTIMLVPSYTNSASSTVRSIRIPHWLIHAAKAAVIATVAIIGGLGILSAYSQSQVYEVTQIAEKREDEKLGLIREKQKLQQEKSQLIQEKTEIEAEKQQIEKGYNSRQGSLENQITEYKNKITEIELRLVEIEKQAKANYDKMNIPGSPVSVDNIETFMGGTYEPVFAESASELEQLKLMVNTLTEEVEKSEQMMAAYTDDVQKFLAFRNSYPDIMPVNGYITSEQGTRSDPITGDMASHTGMDIKAQVGTPVRATANGTVTKSEYNGGYGYLIVINHGSGLETYYAHNSELLASVGDKVQKGDIIAKSGNTGRTTGPHVHYEVRLNGDIKNPRNFIANY